MYWRWFLVTLLALLLPSEAAQDNVSVSEIQREINLSKSYAEIVTRVAFHVHGDVPLTHFVVCAKRRAASREAYFRALLGDTSDGEEMTVTPLETASDLEVPESLICKGLKFLEPLKPSSEEVVIRMKTVYTGCLQPLPEFVNQGEEQRMIFRDNLYALLPYSVKTQMTTVMLSTAEVFSKTMMEPVRQEDKMLIYGPYEDIPPFKLQQLSVHFKHDAQFATAVKVVREVQVSLWGNVYVEEVYEIENSGPKLKGAWSRYDYVMSQGYQANVIQKLVAEIPRNADSMYYTDEIGNISTSKVTPSATSLMAVLTPRYPLFGGWKTKFKFGYSVPLYGSLFHQDAESHVLMFDFSPSISTLVILDYELRVVLPDGSYHIFHELPFEIETERDTKHWYFDLVARPVLVMRKSNVVPQYNTVVRVLYKPTFMAVYRKLFIFATAVFCLFLAIIGYLRMDFKIVGFKEENREKIQSILTEMKISFKDHHESLDELMACIAQMKNSHTTSKNSQIRNRIESHLKDIEVKLTEGMTGLRMAQYRRLDEMTELLIKAKDLQSHCFQLYHKLTALLQAKTSKKEIDQEVQIMEKTISHLSAGVQDAVGYLFL